MPALSGGALDADADDAVMSNLKAVLPMRQYLSVCAVEHCVLDTLDVTNNDKQLKREYMYIVVAADCFYVMPRSFLTERVRSKKKRTAVPVMFDDVIDMEAIIGGEEVFDDAKTNHRSLKLDVTYHHHGLPALRKEKAGGIFSRKVVTLEVPAEPELRKWRVITFARMPRVVFYLPRVWMHIKEVRPGVFAAPVWWLCARDTHCALHFPASSHRLRIYAAYDARPG